MERLIEVVREYPVLYDTMHEDYVKTKLKDEIWRKIANELNYPKGEAAKEQWRKLRDCHRDALRRQKKKMVDATAINKLWIYQKQMEFLLPYMASNFRDSEVMEVVEMAENFAEMGENSGELDNQNDNEVGVNESPSLKKKHKKTDESNLLREALDEMKKRSLERDVRRKHTSSQDDPLLQFFMLMYNTAKRMPTASQLKIKRKLFLAVSEEEEQILNNAAACTTYGASSLPVASGRSTERVSAEHFAIYGHTTSQAETSGNSTKEYDQCTGEEFSRKVFNF